MRKFKLFSLIAWILLTGTTAHGAELVVKIFKDVVVGVGAAIMQLDEEVKKDREKRHAAFIKSNHRYISMYFKPVLPKGFDFVFKNVSSMISAQEVFYMRDGKFLKETGAVSHAQRMRRNQSSVQLVALVHHSLAFDLNMNAISEGKKVVLADKAIIDCLTLIDPAMIEIYKRLPLTSGSQSELAWESHNLEELNKLEQCYEKVLKNLVDKILTHKFQRVALVKEIEHYFKHEYRDFSYIENGAIAKQERVSLKEK